jgi:hypothetical protein
MTNSITALGSHDNAAAYADSQVELSVSGQLATLLVENESVQATADRETIRAARQAYLAEAAQQVAELHEAANALASGALVSAGFAVAGGACTIVSAQLTKDSTAAKDWAAVGATSAQLVKPAQALLGDSSAESHRAAAKDAEKAGEADRWQSGDAQSDLDATNRRTDKVLELAHDLSQDQNAANNAIIGRI